VKVGLLRVFVHILREIKSGCLNGSEAASVAAETLRLWDREEGVERGFDVS